MRKLILHFRNQLFVVGFQNPAVSQGIAVIKHFLVMHPAEAGLVRGLPCVAFHIGSTGTEHVIHDILLHIPFNETEGAFILRVHGVI